MPDEAIPQLPPSQRVPDRIEVIKAQNGWVVSLIWTKSWSTAAEVENHIANNDDEMLTIITSVTKQRNLANANRP